MILQSQQTSEGGLLHLQEIRALPLPKRSEFDFTELEKTARTLHGPDPGIEGNGVRSSFLTDFGTM